MNSMNQIQQAIRKSLDAKDLERFSRLKPVMAYRDLALEWLKISAAFSLVALFPNGWVFFFAFLLIGSSQYGLFILAHDAIHRSLHPNPNINDALAKWFISSPMFMGFEGQRRNHIEHHRLMGSEADPDRYLHALGNKNSRFRFLLFCSGFKTFIPTVLKVISVKSTEAQTLSRKQYFSNLLREYLPILITQSILLFFIFISPLSWWVYPLLWIAPIYFFVFLPDEIRAFCDHAVEELPDRLADSKRLVTFLPTRFESIFISPHNMNYHAEHHLWPNIPYYRLPEIHQWLDQKTDVTIHRGYIQFLTHLFSKLPIKSSETLNDK